MDLIQKLGPLAFASRLKRLAEKLHRDGSLIYKRYNLDFEARWFPVMYALNNYKQVAVTELAKMLNLTHPAINQIAGEMIKRGYLKSTRGRKDERQRFLSLTQSGRKLCLELVPVWKDISDSTMELIDSIDPNLLNRLSEIENSLDQQSMFDRVEVKLKQRMLKKVKILPYRPSLKKYFKQLNLEWLKKDFKIEPPDTKILNDPNTTMIKPGGLVLFAEVDSDIVGTVALKKVNDSVYEICKLAVTKQYRGLGIGRRLVDELIKEAKSRHAQMIILATSPLLIVANNLYKTYGFKETDNDLGILAPYIRKSIVMKLNI
jgi:DNA-binding MarR family transcriptional regulator/GNAT superfamily N-acetyltransferase